MNKFISKLFIASSILAFPALTFAQKKTETLKDLACLALSYGTLVLFLIISLAVVVFVWNIYRYFVVADPANKKESGLYVLYSLIGFFVILSLWGLIQILTNSFALPSNTSFSFSIMPSASFCSGSSGGGSSLPSSSSSLCGPGDYDPSCYPGTSYSGGSSLPSSSGTYGSSLPSSSNNNGSSLPPSSNNGVYGNPTYYVPPTPLGSSNSYQGGTSNNNSPVLFNTP